MKQKSFLLVIAIVFSLISFAQPPGQRKQFNSEEMIKQQTEQMVKNLNLNADQSKKVEALNKKYGEKMAQAFQNANDDREKRREQMQKMRDEKDEQLKAILTADQYKKHTEMEQKRIENRKQKREQRPGNQPDRRGAPRGSEN